MVNGKPTMIYGGSSSPASTPKRAGRFNRLAESFSSFLPQEQAKPKAAPVAAQAAAQPQAAAQNQTRRVSAPSQIGGQMAGQPVGGQGSARFHLGHMPDNYLASSMRDYTPGGALPPGAQSRAGARAKAAPAAQAYQQQISQAQRIPSKTAPRISGRPVTGRNHIGMEDTRQTARAGNSTLSGRNAGNFASANANVARLQTPASSHSTPLASASQASGFSSLFGSQLTGQSFIAHGFGAKNAELALKKMGYDPYESRNLQTYAKRLEPDPYALKNMDYVPPGTTFGATRPVQFNKNEESAITAVKTKSHKKQNEPLPAAAYPERSLVKNFYNQADKGLGTLAAKFESGDEGIAAIGYDRKGGTSYGKYQIASRPGTMGNFINYLKSNAPDLASRLASAGPANTGGRSGKMPAEWRKIANEQPERFENLQSDFIRTSHFEPAMQGIEVATGVSFDAMPRALQEVLFSTAVQHGPAGATRIFSQALRGVDAQQLTAESGKGRKAGQQLITQIYNLRARQFVSSTSSVQSAVRNRLRQEMREAMQLLA